MQRASQEYLMNVVAPVRERGLKCTGKYNREGSASRSREGAWIEIIHTNYIQSRNVASLP